MVHKCFLKNTIIKKKMQFMKPEYCAWAITDTSKLLKFLNKKVLDKIPFEILF